MPAASPLLPFANKPNASAVRSDEEIVKRVLAGETADYEHIMRRYNQRLFRITRSLVSNDHDAEDVLQETYVRAFRHLSQFAFRGSFSTWLTKITCIMRSSIVANGRAQRQLISTIRRTTP